MASHLKGVKKTTMTDEIRRALCKHNKDNPSLTQKQLQEWVHSNYGLQTPEVLTMLRKIRDEIQGEIDFNKKQKTIESFFKKPS